MTAAATSAPPADPRLSSTPSAASQRRFFVLPASAGLLFLEHDAEKCARFSDDIMLYFFDLDQDPDFRPDRA
ncbi:hypothetical protein GFM29_26795 [Rhizobium leguminosarum bv. viciae]|nr:hypothetical protein [Rhizobium leguminosarum bv. viciae]